MTVIDYSTPTGKLRMRLGDTSSLPFLSDAIYAAVYAEKGDNLQQATIACGSMILGQLAFKTHRRLSVQLELWGAEAYHNYRNFLLLTVTNPAFMDISPLPYTGSTEELHAIVQFQEDWNKNFYAGTESQQLAVSGSVSPNDGSLYGPLGNNAGWTLS